MSVNQGHLFRHKSIQLVEYQRKFSFLQAFCIAICFDLLIYRDKSSFRTSAFNNIIHRWRIRTIDFDYRISMHEAKKNENQDEK